MLAEWLDYHRDTFAWKCSGLTAEQLKERPVPPSRLSLLGMLRHLTEVERGWFQKSFLGREIQPIYYSDVRPDDDFDATDDQDPDEAYRVWQEACQESRRIVAGAPLDAEGTPGKSADGSRPTLRWIMIHILEEYARHNGHADLIRERIDGATGE